MARDRAGHVNRAFLGLKLADRVARPGAKVFQEGKQVGVTTSSVPSLKLNAPMALAYLKRGHQEVGTPMEVEDEDGRQAAAVVGLPVGD